jgi:hypothetical protein
VAERLAASQGGLSCRIVIKKEALCRRARMFLAVELRNNVGPCEALGQHLYHQKYLRNVFVLFVYTSFH